MIWRHPAHADRIVRLAYCQNLHPSDGVEEMLEKMRSITLPLRERIAPNERFGVGLYLSNNVARTLASERGEQEVLRFARFLETNALDPFTVNAFPHSRFTEPGLKSGVFKPTWRETERLEFTLAVAHSAAALWRRSRPASAHDHVSISTHTGMFGSLVKSEKDLDECAANMARAVDGLARIEEESGVRIVLALEPEPRANAGDTLELEAFLTRATKVAIAVLSEERNRDEARSIELVKRHLGVCLDCCHAAVEFESDSLSTIRARVLGKVQYSNALRVERPGTNSLGVEALLALDEPRYLHQVTGRGAARLAVDDIGDLKAALDSPARADWLALDEWRCHMHVPVDLESAGAGLSTTRDVADSILREVLRDPTSWTTSELHLEIETYTWDVLPDLVRGEGSLVDGLAREYGHVIAVLERAGWTRG